MEKLVNQEVWSLVANCTSVGFLILTNVLQ